VVQVPDEIAPGDKLRVTVFQVESLSGEYRVEENGQIDFPLIGIVQAQGQTPSQFAKLLAARLGERNLRNPNVQVAVAERAQQTITIEGAVNQPAVVPIRGQTTLLKAIALARGTTAEANASQVVVFRQVRGQRMAAAFDLRAIRRAEATDPVIYPNDVVVVSDNGNRKLLDTILRAVPVLGIFRPI
jgi:polysaccharide export outer membrane protein